MNRVHTYRNLAILIVVVLTSTALVSCGQPSQKYATSKSEGTYFTVPVEWHEVTMKELSAVEAKSTVSGAAEKLLLVKWQEAYSPDSEVGPTQVFSAYPTTKPLVFVRVRWLFPDEVNSLSYNTLRDLVEPVTDWVNNPASNTPDYNIVDDFEVVQEGGRGVRTIFNFVHKGLSQTIDQTALMSKDGQKIYLLVMRCTTKCYHKNKKIFAKIAKSFTVKGDR